LKSKKGDGRETYTKEKLDLNGGKKEKHLGSRQSEHTQNSRGWKETGETPAL